MDYNKYVYSIKENVQSVLIAFVLTGILAGLFYRSLWGMLLFPFVYVFYRRSYTREQIMRQKMRLRVEFKDTLQVIATGLLAGYSLENVWQDAATVIEHMHGTKSLMLAEIRRINAAIAMNQPMERVLTEFAARSGCEEIESFAEVLSFAKRGGGDFVKITRATTQKIIGRIEVEQEIETVLSGKKLEGRIMNLMPILILAYMTISAGDFLDVLYGNAIGVAIMSGVLAGYALTMRLSAHILDIRI